MATISTPSQLLTFEKEIQMLANLCFFKSGQVNKLLWKNNQFLNVRKYFSKHSADQSKYITGKIQPLVWQFSISDLYLFKEKLFLYFHNELTKKKEGNKYNVQSASNSKS